MKYIERILMMSVIVLLAACSQDNAEEQAQEPDASLRLAVVSRSILGESECSDIRVFLTHETTATEGLFKYAGSSAWHTRLKLKSGARTYNLYGYMPDDAGFERSISDFDDNSAVLHIRQMPPIVTQDYCIVTGVRQVNDENDKRTPVRGTFSFDYDSQRENYINLFVDHLYSHVIFRMMVSEEYNTVRTIKIKRMKLLVADISHYDVDITLTKGVGISSVAHTSTTSAGTHELTIRDEELTLTTSSTPVCSGYIIPATTLFDNLSLVIDYDIYDKRGNKIAERSATNALAYPLEELQRGEERTLQITIDPSYLYDLSQNDPPIVIIKK